MVQLFVRFLLVGGLNATFGYSCFALLVYLGAHYSLALFLSTVAGVIFNFKSTGKLVFSSSRRHSFLRFVCVYAVVYGANLAGMRVLEEMKLNPYASAALLILPVALIAFFLQKRYVFSHD